VTEKGTSGLLYTLYATLTFHIVCI